MEISNNELRAIVVFLNKATLLFVFWQYGTPLHYIEKLNETMYDETLLHTFNGSTHSCPKYFAV